MPTSTVHIAIYVGLAIAVGSAMPNRMNYKFPREIGLYLFDWVYATVKIVTFNVLKEAEKKGLNIEIPPQNVTTQITTESKENPPQ